jgi:hypothetical protein
MLLFATSWLLRCECGPAFASSAYFLVAAGDQAHASLTSNWPASRQTSQAPCYPDTTFCSILLDPAFVLLFCHSPSPRLQLDDVKTLLQIEAPALLTALLQRQDDMADLDSSGWQTVTSSHRGAAAAAATKDALQHWARGDPVSDWHFKQQLLQAQQEAAMQEWMIEQGLVDENCNPWYGSGIAGSPFQAAGGFWQVFKWLFRDCCKPSTLNLACMVRMHCCKP